MTYINEWHHAKTLYTFGPAHAILSANSQESNASPNDAFTRQLETSREPQKAPKQIHSWEKSDNVMGFYHMTSRLGVK